MAKNFIRAGWLLDGRGGPAQEDILLCLENGHISSVKPFSFALGIKPEELHDFSHCTILPPLVDSHVHLFMSATTDLKIRKKQLDASYQELLPVIRLHMEDLFGHGVLAVLDGGDYGGYALRFSREEEFPAMQLKTSGCAWHRQGHYGRLIGRTPESYGTDDLLKAFFLAQRQTGIADFVKIMQSGPVSLHDLDLKITPQFSDDDLRTLVSAAKKCGNKVMAYANGAEPVQSVIEAGCDALLHGLFMGEENLRRLRDSDCVWVPAIYTIRGFRANLQILGDKARRSVVERILDHHLYQLRAARELGVKVALGTDAGSLGTLHGESVVEEIRLFKKAGYSLAEAICCSCRQGADLLGLKDFGVISAGQPATFLVSRGTPSQLPRKLLYLDAIFYFGKVVSSSFL